MKHVAIYLRVSTKAQDTKSQEPDLKTFASTQGEEVVWYRDSFTGKTMDRPGWNRLMEAVKAGKVSKVVCWRLDRLGRTARGLTALFEELTEKRVGLVSIKDGIDLSTPAGRMIANVLASIAQFETEVRAERVRAGQAAAKAEGKTWGGSEKGRRLYVTEEQVKTIQRMKAEGESVSAISRATGLSRQTVYQYIPKAEATA